MPVYRIDLGYDGAGFRGYAIQPNTRTVQGELERALGIALSRRDPPATSVAGRTDAGVHAKAQVVSFTSVDPVANVPKLFKSLNTMLGPEVVVYGIAEEGPDFDARLSAQWRSYRYRVLTSDHPDPFRRSVTYWYPQVVDIDAMNRGAAHLLGEHDYASLCRQRDKTRTTERALSEAVWTRHNDELLLTIKGRAFCHQLVRSIVALCLDIGRGRVDPAAVPAILEAKDRNAASGAAPPHGLILWEVGY